MSCSTMPALSNLYYIYPQGARRGGRACQRHRIFDARHQLVAEGCLHRTFHPSPVSFSGDLERPDVVLRLRKSFPLTGKIDIRDAVTGELLGVTTRGYRLYDASERLLAQFDGGVPLKEWLGQALAEAALDAALGSGGDGSSQGPHELALTGGGRELGALRHLALPFFPDPTSRARPGAAGKMVRRLIPSRFQRWLDATPPRGWALELHSAIEIDQRLLLCASMMTVEMRNWKSG